MKPPNGSDDPSGRGGEAALVVGVGPSSGLGAAIARRFASEGLAVFLVGRTSDRLASVADQIIAAGGEAHVVTADATLAGDMARAFSVASDGHRLAAAIFNAGNNRPPRSLLQTDPEFFEDVWRVVCLAGHLFAVEAARVMLPRGGTALFTGASASMRGRAGYAAFAAAKAGLRAVVQSSAREFGPQGLHVGHVVIDGGLDGEKVNTYFPTAKADRPPDGLMSLDAVADAYWRLHTQHRSAWTLELDLRPYCEVF